MDLIVSWSLSFCPMPFQFHPTCLIFEHPISKNKINVTCMAQKFYPQGIQLTWIKNVNVPQIHNTLTPHKQRWTKHHTEFDPGEQN